MKCTGFLTTFSLILFVKVTRGQNNGLLQNQNVEVNNNIPQQQPQNSLVNSIQRYLNRKNNVGVSTNVIDQEQIQKNIVPSLSNSQQIRQQPHIDQQSGQLKQFLQQQPLQPLQMLQPFQTKLNLQLQRPQQIVQSPQPIQEIQQPHSLQQNSQPLAPSLQQNVDLLQPLSNQQHNFPASVNSNLQLQPFKLQDSINVGPPLSSQNLIVQSPHNPKHVTEVVSIPQQSGLSPQDLSSTVYFGSPQQSPNLLTAKTPVSFPNPSIGIIPNYNIKSTEQNYVPMYNSIKPSTEIQAAIVDKPEAISSVPALAPVLIPPVQTANVQTYYYNLPAANPRQNLYINQNSQSQYQQPKLQVTPVQTQSAAVVPSQTPILPSPPLSFVQAQFPQYASIYSGYPTNTIVAPAYKSTTSNLKSLLPIILNLLKDKVNSCGCQNSCPCNCNNQRICNELEVSGGYSSLKNYGALHEDAFSVINTASEELDSPACLRERKNLKTKKITSKVTEETGQEDIDSEEVEDDEEEE